MHLCHLISSAWFHDIVTSLAASVVFFVVALCIAWFVREKKARLFLGDYKMFDPKTKEPRNESGNVNVKHQRRFLDTDTSAQLKVLAEHEPGKEDWKGTLEVRGLSDIATGFYLHPNHTGGFLQFTRVTDDGSEIMEQGHPHDLQYDKFERLLRRVTPQPPASS